MLALAWLVTTGVGMQRILAGDRAGHRAWITRSFALTFAAVSLRMQAPLLGLAGVPEDVAYPLVAWSSWVPNLLFVHVAAAARNSAGVVPVQRRNARVNELCFEWLDAPVRRVAAHDVPLPYAPALEDFVLPQTSDIVRAARWVAAY